MPEEKTKDTLLDKIAKLLAKAESSQFEGEREAFFKAADNLMNKYRIELWEIQQREAGKVAQRDPIVRDFDYAFAFESGPFPEIADGLWSLFISVARHANCVIVYHKQHYSGETKTYKGNIVPVIGTESDLGYMTLLFSSLMTQLLDATHPKVDKNRSYEENLRTFREAGWGWLEVAAKMQEAGYDLGMTVSAARHKEAHAYRRWCKRMNIPQDYAHFKTYRRNFSAGFAAKVGERLRAMRTEAAQESGGTGLELVLADQKSINERFMFDMFPNTGSSGRAVAKSSKKLDNQAMAAGSAAGSRANITINPSQGLKGRKSLNK